MTSSRDDQHADGVEPDDVVTDGDAAVTADARAPRVDLSDPEQAPEAIDPEVALEQIGDVARQGLEALLFLADEPVPVDVLADAVEHDPHVVAAALTGLQQRFAEDHRGMEIRRAAGGWRMYSAPGARAALERWALTGRTGRLTQAALETLAVIAYKQPISRQDIGEIRGVSADGAVRSLVARGFVVEVGRDPGPGQAVLYGTTTAFLERLGLDSLDQLPPLTDYLPEAPAPDEPELGALRAIRQRLAAAGGRDQAGTEDPTGAMPPPPSPTRLEDQSMDALTDRLESAARNAMARLRSVAKPDADTDDPETDDPDGDVSQDPEQERTGEAGDA